LGHVVLHDRHREGRPLITDKKVVLKNDHIHHVIDVYHI
jgi:3-phenylpropionate/cinnamic acid dioxygenase small subunit